jgi:serine protease inhibitor
MPSLFPWFKKDATATRPQRYTDSIRTLPSTEFAFRLFEKLNPGQRNLAVCPYSARVMLGMLWEGSTGETRNEMSGALQLNEDPNSYGNCYERLGRPLGFQLETERHGLEMLTANSLWCDDGLTPKEEYAKTLKEHYWAEIRRISFRAPDAAERVNGWAHEKTHGRIPAIVSSLYEFSPLVALNAVYFKGLWVKPFEAEQTKEEQFTLRNGKKELVPMMRRSGRFRYQERDGAQIVSLPYKGRMNMCVVLPPRETSFPKFCAELSSTIGTSWTVAMEERPGHLRLPRFRIETQANLTAPLRALGVVQVFDPARAALEGIIECKPLYLMGVLQKDFVEVNEKGTEAAAVTHVMVGAAMHQAPPPPPFEMIVDRPFLFAICDDFTGTVVFLGAVADPLASGPAHAGE